MTDAERIAAGLTWIEQFTLRHVLGGRWIFPSLPFEMTSSERSAARLLEQKGLVRPGWFTWRLSPIGLAVRAVLEGEG